MVPVTNTVTKMTKNRPLILLKALQNRTRNEDRNENGPNLTSTAPVSLQKGTRNEMVLNR